MKLVVGEEPHSDGEKLGSHDSDYDSVGYKTDCFEEEEEEEDTKKEIRKTEEMPMNDHHNPEEKSTEGIDLEDSEKSSCPNNNLTAKDYVDSYALEAFWEHQELIEQLKLEFNMVRADALPTNPEDYEFLNLDHLKPRKIDEKLHGRIGKYGKALELWKSPYKTATYNEVAGEFQKFKEYLQRFVEGECSEERTRVENYVNNRYKMSLLLQVPVVRGDSLKDRRKTRRKGRDDGEIISSDDLAEKLEESITTMWQFIRADKYASSSINASQKRRREHLPETDLNLLAEVQTDLHKKNMKLKEILRSRNSMLKRFRKHEEEGTDDHLYFFSEVDMK
ncbi:hypothetical protein DVH24_022637 [Malus domestica]|uniref:Uncharacterized protein n=1 Tax=Malus domestica TaxID=3750 RepID=A0A498KU51_MALDO|nr:hypothetical protein DVH24_022637 [Malus domestica]